MRRRLVFVGVLVAVGALWLASAPAAAAEAPAGTVNGTYEGIAGVNDVVQTAGGNYLLVGLDDSQPGDAVVTKVTPEGEQLWQRTYGDDRVDTFWGGTRAPGGGYVLVGATNTSDGDIDAWAVRIDDTGARQWSQTYGADGFDEFNDVATARDGRLIAAGTTESAETGAEAWAVKLTSRGDRVWGFVYWTDERAGDELFNGIARTPADTYVLAGSEYISDADESDADDDWDAAIVEIDGDGELVGSDRYGHSMLDDSFRDVAVDADGTVYLAGLRNGAFNDSRDRYDFGDAWVRSLDQSRETRWSHTTVLDDYQQFDAVEPVPGGVVAAGRVRPVTGDRDGLLAKVTDDGSTAWNLTAGGPGYEDFDGLAVRTRNNRTSYAVAGERTVGGAFRGWLQTFETSQRGPVVVDGPATDPDADGTYEDVNGDGRFTILDVVGFLNNFDRPAVQSNAAAFDFTGDGRVTILDVVGLLDEV